MAFQYTVDELINSIKTRCLVPISQVTFSNNDILNFANEEIELKMVPNILRVKEEFYVIEEEFELDGEDNRYNIPYRAIGSKLRNVQFKSGDNKYPVSRIQPELVPYFQHGNNAHGSDGFYLEGNDVVILSKTGLPTGKVVLTYYLKPNRLVSKDRVGVIQSIDRVGDGTTGSITLSNNRLPSNFTAGGQVDFLEAKPNFRTYSFDVEVTTINPTTRQIFLPLDKIPTKLKIGDHVASAGECITPQIPSELQSMLAQTVACRLLEAMGDENNLKIAERKLNEMEKNLFTVIDSRTEGNPQKINNINGMLVRSKIGHRKYGGYKP